MRLFIACILIFISIGGSGCWVAAIDSTQIPTPAPTPVEIQKVVGQGEVPIWSDEQNGIGRRWTNRDLYLTAGDSSTPIFSRYAARLVSDHVRRNGKSPGCESVFGFTVLSLVGSIMSVEVDSHTECSSYVDGFETYLVTFQLNSMQIAGVAKHDDRPRKLERSNLRSLFSEREITDSLLDTPEIKRSLQANTSMFAVTSLAGLERELRKNEANGVDSTGHFLSSRSLENFYFDRVEGDRVVVQIELTTGANSTTHPRLALTLPIKAAIGNSLRSAAARESGFLRADAEKIANGMSSVIRIPLDRP